MAEMTASGLLEVIISGGIHKHIASETCGVDGGCQHSNMFVEEGHQFCGFIQQALGDGRVLLTPVLPLPARHAGYPVASRGSSVAGRTTLHAMIWFI